MGVFNASELRVIADFDKFRTEVAQRLSSVPKLKSAVLEKGQCKLYIIERIEEIFDCVEKCDGVFLDTKFTNKKLFITICGSDPTFFNSVGADIEVRGLWFKRSLVDSYGLKKLDGSFTVSIFLPVLPKKLVGVKNALELTWPSTIKAVEGVAYNKKVSAEEFETRWSLQMVDGFRGSVARDVAAWI